MKEKEEELQTWSTHYVSFIRTTQIHLPDRTTRNLPPLPSKTPLVISLSGSGARGDASEAVKVSSNSKLSAYNV